MAEEEGDGEILPDIEQTLKEVSKSVTDIELKSMLSGEHDLENAILEIHPGSGGTEAQDWAEMLLRMYLRWAERHGYKASIVDYQQGEEAGIKSVTVTIDGNYAYGYLKSETGVHRLVRVSPFDANNRRHTSFSSVFVCPDIEKDIVIDIKEDDLRIDTFRASGAGGQHVNKTDSAVRIVHIPTGIEVRCQNERSQHKNKEVAMKILRSKLYELQLKEQESKIEEFHKTKKEITWGSQIRSYVLYPYRLIKDHRTNYETSNVDDVLDGELDNFIKQYLFYIGKSSNNGTNHKL